MWGFLSDEENPYTKKEDDVVQEVEPPSAGTTGQRLKVSWRSAFPHVLYVL